MVFVPCNICGCSDYYEICEIEISPILIPSKLVKCRNCGFFYANPRLIKEEEEDYYKSSHYKEEEKDFWYKGRIDVFKRSLLEIGKFFKRGKLLDIGCGMGYFMDLARSNGWEAKGVEVSDYAVGFAKDKLGLDVVRGTLKGAHFESAYFEVVTMWNTLDQVYDPKENLIESNRILKKGGYLFLRVTNLYFHLNLLRLYHRLRPVFWNIKKSPSVFHLYSFDKNSIKKMLESTGFSQVVVKTEPLGVNVPAFVEIFGKKREKYLRGLFNLVVNSVWFIGLGNIIISPSLFVIAKK